MNKNYPTFGGKFSAGLSKLHLTSPEKHFEDFLEENTFLFITFGLYPQKNIQLLAEKFRQACQKCNLGVQENILS